MTEYRQATILRIALTNSIGFSASTAVPVWVGGVGAHFGFPTWVAGVVATGQLGCAALLNVATPWLFPDAHLKRLAFAAAAVALLGNGLALLGPSFAFIAGCLLCGAGFGVLLNVTNRLVADSIGPQRGYATVQVVEVLFCIGFYLAVPPLVVRFGILSVFAVLTALCAGVFALIAGVPMSGPHGSTIIARDAEAVSTPVPGALRHRRGGHPNTGAALLSLCAAAALFAGYSSVSASLVSIGATAHLSVQWVGRLMALSLLASFGGAAVARGLGERTGVLLPLLAGAGVLAGDMLVITLGGDTRLFIGGAIVLFMCMVFLVPYMFALLASLDNTGRWASIAPGFLLAGVALGPSIAAFVTRDGDFTRLGHTASLCVAGAVALFLCGERLRLTAGDAEPAQPLREYTN